MSQYDHNLTRTAQTDTLSTAVIVLDACNTLSFAAAVDPMRAANRLAGRRVFDWRYVTVAGAPARLTSGIEVPGEALVRVDHCDLLILVAGFDLEAHNTRALRAGLRRLAQPGTIIAGIDGGPWLLAEAGLLDGHSATTHWEDLDEFAARFPQVHSLRDRFCVSGDRLTSGGATPAIEMMLHLISRRHGPRFAGRVAGLFLYDAAPDPSRPQIRTGAPLTHSPLTARASRVMERTLAAPLPLSEIARQIGTGARNLQQHFRTALGTTAQAHYLDLRLAEARRLVTDTSMSLTDIALATGFSSQSSFARAFRRAHGCAARDLRTQSRPRPAVDQ